jgi:hypothetical protein
MSSLCVFYKARFVRPSMPLFASTTSSLALAHFVFVSAKKAKNTINAQQKDCQTT